MSPVTTRNLDETIAAFKALPGALRDAGEPIAIDATAMIQEVEATYPPQPPTSYVRTGSYGEAIVSRVETTEEGATGTVTAMMDYSIWVRGEYEGRGPAWMHVGIWDSLTQLVEQLMPRIMQAAQQRVAAAIARLFGG